MGTTIGRGTGNRPYDVYDKAETVSKAGIETITGQKTFTAPVKVADATLADEATSKGQLDGKPTGFKNLIINGGFDVWQRGTSFNVGGYNADRWTFASNTDDTFTFTRVDVLSNGEAGLPINFSNMLKFAVTAGTTGSLNDLRTRLELPKQYSGQTLTLSYYIKSTNACTIGNRRVSFVNVTDAPPDTSLPTLNIIGGLVWTKVTNTFTLSVNSLAVYTDSSYLDVVIGLPILTTTDIYITGVQLEQGSVATPFEQRPYGLELSLCQRYYEFGANQHWATITADTKAYQQEVTFTFKQEKRVLPTMTYVNNSDATLQLIGPVKDRFSVRNNSAGASTPTDNNISWTADAEL